MTRKKKVEIDFSNMERVDKPNLHINSGLHLYMSLKTRVSIILCVITLIGIMSCVLISKGYSGSDTKKINYTQKQSIDYTVGVNDDSYMNENVDFSKVEAYVASNINFLDIDFNYKFGVDELMDFDYVYRITGEMFIYGEYGDVLYNENIDFSSGEEKLEDSSILSLSKNEQIDYQYYYNKATKYLNDNNVNGRAEMIIYMDTKITGMIEEFNKDVIINSANANIVVPLSGNEIRINDVNKKTPKSKGEYEQFIRKNKQDEVMVYFGLVMFIVDIMIVIYLVSFLYKIVPKKSNYEKIKNKILKKYDSIIVDSKKEPKYNKKNVVSVDDFDELVDAQSNLNKPIIYFEITKGQKALFVIIGEDISYRYILKECDVDE